MKTKKNISDLNTDDFFLSMNKQEVIAWKLMYKDYLTYTTNNFNIGTGKNYTKIEIINLHTLANKNLKIISKILE